jgi:hypothetical protein
VCSGTGSQGWAEPGERVALCTEAHARDEQTPVRRRPPAPLRSPSSRWAAAVEFGTVGAVAAQPEFLIALRSARPKTAWVSAVLASGGRRAPPCRPDVSVRDRLRRGP